MWVAAIVAGVGSIPGIAALVGAFFWFGRLSARLDAVENDLGDLKGIGREVATIAERTKNTDELVKGVAGDIRAITGHLLDEGRGFAREVIRKNGTKPPAQPR